MSYVHFERLASVLWKFCNRSSQTGASYQHRFISIGHGSSDLQLWAVMLHACMCVSMRMHCVWIWYKTSNSVIFILCMSTMNMKSFAIVTSKCCLNRMWNLDLWPRWCCEIEHLVLDFILQFWLEFSTKSNYMQYWMLAVFECDWDSALICKWSNYRQIQPLGFAFTLCIRSRLAMCV